MYFSMATNEGVINVDDKQEDGVEVPGEGDIEEENNAKPKLRSIVWQHFPYVKGAKKAECTHCKKVLACGTRENDTSSLLSHLVNSCRRSPLYEGKDKDAKKQTKPSFKPKGTSGWVFG